MRAIFAGNIEVANYFIEQCGDAVPHSLRNISGDTAFSIACKYGQLSIAELLLKKGASVNQRDDTGSYFM